MQQFGLHSRIGTQREGETAFRTRQPASALDQTHPAGAETNERPPGPTLLCGSPLGLVRGHLQLAVEVVCHDCREEPRLVGGATSAGDVVHLSLRLQLCEDRFLCATPVVKRQELARRQCGVGQDDLELIAVLVGSERVQLQRALALLGLTGADEDETPRLLPAFRLPVAFEEAHFAIGTVPDVSLLDHGLQLRQALEGDRDRVLDAESIQCADDLIGEERAVHAHLEAPRGQAHAVARSADRWSGRTDREARGAQAAR